MSWEPHRRIDCSLNSWGWNQSWEDTTLTPSGAALTFHVLLQQKSLRSTRIIISRVSCPWRSSWTRATWAVIVPLGAWFTTCHSLKNSNVVAVSTCRGRHYACVVGRVTFALTLQRQTCSGLLVALKNFPLSSARTAHCAVHICLCPPSSPPTPQRTRGHSEPQQMAKKLCYFQRLLIRACTTTHL